MDVPRDVAVAAEVAEAGAWADSVQGLAERAGDFARVNCAAWLGAGFEIAYLRPHYRPASEARRPR